MILDHHRAVLEEMKKLPQPFRMGDCAPFYGLPKSNEIDPLIRPIISALLASGDLREIEPGLFTTEESIDGRP